MTAPAARRLSPGAAGALRGACNHPPFGVKNGIQPNGCAAVRRAMEVKPQRLIAPGPATDVGPAAGVNGLPAGAGRPGLPPAGP